MNLLGLFRVDEQFSGTGPVAIRVLPCNPDERHAVLKMSLKPSLGRWTKVCCCCSQADGEALSQAPMYGRAEGAESGRAEGAESGRAEGAESGRAFRSAVQ